MITHCQHLAIAARASNAESDLPMPLREFQNHSAAAGAPL